MPTTVNWMRVLSIVATLALSAEYERHVLGQELRERRFDGARSEQLPPPERPNAVADGPALISPSGADRSQRTGRPYLGITFDPRYPDAAVARSVVPGGPAAQAGIQPGDTIETINDYSVSSYRDAYAIMAALQPGEIVDIDYSRRVSGRTQAVLGDDPGEDPFSANYANETTAASYPERPASAVVDESLPEPTYDSDFRSSDDRQFNGSSRNMRSNYYNGAATRDYDGTSARQLNRPPARRPDERTRADERGFRRRPLLPWRRR
ncbi:MAG TPA: PDZ domain-containing protein [Lacipirellulaceae bacterium]|nr:PDZ domain-containing protein [Lacipirellulaceae bacterium]